MTTRLFSVLAVGLLLAGCARSAPNTPIAAQPASLVCAGYGLRTGTATFDQCVAYRETRDPGASVPPYRLNQNNNRVDAEGYMVDSMGRRMRP